jgi:purine-binding chemotaxis protein CheW
VSVNEEILKQEPVEQRKSFLAFRLDAAQYGIEIFHLRELVGGLEISLTPGLKEPMRGLINLRHKSVPVMDLRARFDLTPSPNTAASVIIVVQPSNPQDGTTVGLIVDELIGMRTVSREALSVPGAGLPIGAHFVSSVVSGSASTILVLDLERVLLRPDQYSAGADSHRATVPE